jgi:hypothetical protein
METLFPLVCQSLLLFSYAVSLRIPWASFFQGSLFQVSLAGSAGSLACGAFLSFIRLTLYPPYSSVYVSLSWALPQAFAS